jgi:hypothetical protein
VLGDLLDVDEPFFIHHQLRAAHPGDTHARVPPLERARISNSELTCDYYLSAA